MPKPKLQEHRFDFRGGLNLSTSEDNLNPNELLSATNARLQTSYGAIAKRTGSRRMHTLPLGAAIRGLVQWDSPSGKQVVAIANGRLYHKTSEYGDFSEVIPGVALSTTSPTHFFTFRDKTASAALKLYMTSNGNVYSWDGTTLSKIDGVSSVPSGYLGVEYHTRAFMVPTPQPKHLYWSKIGLASDFGSGTAADGGNAMVDVLSGDSVLALMKVGGSLAILTNDAIVRYTGYSSDDIQIAQDTEGISSEVGIVGQLAGTVVEKMGVILSDRGPYAFSESGLQSIGDKVEPVFEDMNRALLSNVAVGHHRGRREVWFAYAADGDSANYNVLVWNYRLQAWYGPFEYAAFSIRTLARYEASDGSELLMSGGDDGYVRLMDTGSLDDVLADGSGGSAYTMSVELAPVFFETGPAALKSLAVPTFGLQADLPATTALQLGVAWDEGAFTSYSVTGAGAGVQPYRVDASGQGGRLRLRFTDASSDIPVVHGLSMHAYNMQRPAQ